MDEHTEGVLPSKRRLKPSSRKPIIAVAAVLCTLMLLYFALCAVVSAGGKILPNTTARGVDLGGLTQAQAVERLETTDFAALRTPQADAPLLIHCAGQAYPVPLDGIDLHDPYAVAQEAWHIGRRGGFLGGGAALVNSLLRGQAVPAPMALNAHGLAVLDEIKTTLDAAVTTPVRETTWQVTRNALVLQKGVAGRVIDWDGLEAALIAAYDQSDADGVTAEPVVTQPEATDFAALAKDLAVAPADARFDPETREIVPSVTGVTLDAARAEALFDAVDEGATCTVPLDLTEPSVSDAALAALLFRDVLGEYTSSVGGTNNRAANVNLAAQACNDIILLPGEIFSYNTATGSRTAAKGYLPAPAYVGGLSVDEIGGGICQVSSTIYAAALRADMKMIERANHMYGVGYVPDGQDATVYFGSLDFRFENNTNYPLKLTCAMQNRRLTVQLIGTREGNTYVVMEGKQLSSTAWKTVYRPDPNIPPGTTKEEVTPYTGRKVEAYRVIYDDNGTPDDRKDDVLVSRTLESVNTYRHRDKLILFNPADAASLQLDPVTGEHAPAPQPDPQPGPEPSPEPQPEPSPDPQPEPQPEPEPEPSLDPNPEPNPDPVADPEPEPITSPDPQPEPTPAD